MGQIFAFIIFQKRCAPNNLSLYHYMNLILLYVWAESAVFGSAKNALEFKSEIWICRLTIYISMYGAGYKLETWKKEPMIKSVYKWMFLYKWPLYDLFWPFFCHTCVYLPQNWGSDGHFEVLNGSKSWLGWKLWHKMQIFWFFFLWLFINTDVFVFCIFCVFVFLS